MFQNRRSSIVVARVVFGVFLITGFFCPCRGSAFSIRTAHSAESTCCEICAEERQGGPNGSDTAPVGCECESCCCDSFLVPDKDDHGTAYSLTTQFTVVPVVNPIEILAFFPHWHSPALDSSGDESPHVGSLLPDLGSLLI